MWSLSKDAYTGFRPIALRWQQGVSLCTPSPYWFESSIDRDTHGGSTVLLAADRYNESMIEAQTLWPPSRFLTAYRHNPGILDEPFAAKLLHDFPTGNAKHFDDQAQYRLKLIRLLFESESSSDIDQKLLRLIVEQELSSLRSSWGTPLALKGSVILLSQLSDITDVPLLWEAKTANFDTFSSIDVQLLVGGGVERSIDFLKEYEMTHVLTKVRRDDNEGMSASAYLEAGQRSGDFKELTWHRESIISNFRDDLFSEEVE